MNTRKTISRSIKFARSFSLRCTSICALTSALLIGSASSTNADPPPRVQGAFHLAVGDLDWVHTFNAKQHPNGTISGQSQISLRMGNTLIFRSRLQIECMYFIDASTVAVVGQTIEDTDPRYIGSNFFFIVRDNGNGLTADEWAGPFYSVDQPPTIPVTCDIEALLAGLEYQMSLDSLTLEDLFQPVAKGEIRVRP